MLLITYDLRVTGHHAYSQLTQYLLSVGGVEVTKSTWVIAGDAVETITENVSHIIDPTDDCVVIMIPRGGAFYFNQQYPKAKQLLISGVYQQDDRSSTTRNMS